ncbi:hypothetical protein [Bacillus yapensis]|uniref:hypothetical protein n=1 Tax=Bacillus yapensis TaxID=2492960 RepID=UPI0014854B3D|nr:hypothetical protein [Bacillus yapensis]
MIEREKNGLEQGLIGCPIGINKKLFSLRWLLKSYCRWPATDFNVEIVSWCIVTRLQALFSLI